jgi:hypothetical protein
MYTDLSGQALYLACKDGANWWDFVAGAYVGLFNANCKAAATETMIDATQSVYSFSPATWPTTGAYGVFLDAAIDELTTAMEPVVDPVENVLFGQRNWNKAAATETIKRLDGTTAKVYDLTVDGDGDIVQKVPRQ